jgi:hypothetical protein
MKNKIFPGSYLTAAFAQQVGLIMWLAVGNTIVLGAYVFVFFWVPQVPPDVLERAREEKAVEIAGWLKHISNSRQCQVIANVQKLFWPR